MSDTYYDPMSGAPIGAQAQEPPPSLPEWAMGALANPGSYEPQVGMWPTPKPPPAPEEKPNPLIPFSAWRATPPKRTAGTIAADIESNLIPTSPQDIGLAIATGGGSIPLRMGALAAGAALDPGEAQAGAGKLLSRARDPRLWSAISDQKLRKPLAEMEHSYTDVRTPVPKIVDPASLVGGYGIFTPSDLSAANRTVTAIDGTKLQRPVTAHGGVGFPEANPGTAWASEAPVASKLNNQAARLMEDTGKPVYIMPMTMSGTSIDASHHVADPLAQMVQTAKIKKDDAAAFDAMMRQHDDVMNRDWVGIHDKGFEDYIANLQSGMKVKSAMADRMSLAAWQNKGFPDIAAIRHAMSDPGLIEMPRNTTGMAISRYVPGQGLLETAHPSYGRGVAGQYMGQLASLLPFDVAAPDIAKGLAARNAANKAMGKTTTTTPAYHMGRPAKGVPTEQEFTQEWLDNVMKHWGR